MPKEFGLGLGLALLVFLAAGGYDVGPLLFLAGAAAGLYYLARTRGLFGRTFQSVPAAPQGQVSFQDIGGQRAAVEELREALDFMRDHQALQRLGIRPLRGILLSGPPGTGKTLLARAAASYTDAVYLAASGSEFVEVYAGVGAQRVRQLFRSARETARRLGKRNAVIFIDELEVLGGKRGKVTSHLEYDQTLNQLLVEMDGLRADDDVRILVMAATNRADMLDPALLRPGRFDRHVRVDMPDREGRVEILRLHTRNKPLAPEVDLEAVARETFGFSGAHLESLANEAAILALREGSPYITMRHFQEAVDKVIMGNRLDRRPTAEELRRVAVHETGHAMVSEMVLPGSVSYLAVTPRGNALGYIRQAAEEDPYLYSKEYLEKRIAVLLAGAVAEELVLGDRSTGATADFEQAAQLAETILRAGMSELGVVVADSVPTGLKHRVLTGILRRQEEWVRAALGRARDVLERVVGALLDREKLPGEELRELMNRERISLPAWRN
ncbi:MAG: AAA family ATPase [Firmicutes bacterium]|nr:AAA family ATPase [Bacillota bacterium]